MRRFFFLLSAWLLLAPPAMASIPEVPFRDLSEKNISAAGKEVLLYRANEWRHAETEHFVYHFTDAKAAETVYIHAEVYYGWIRDLFGMAEKTPAEKSHIYVFRDPEDWKDFKKKTALAVPQAGAFVSGTDLFMYRDSFWLSPKKTLAHELTHLVLARFLKEKIPLALNEGFAEYISYRAVSTGFDGDEYRIRTLRLLPVEKWQPLSSLLSKDAYPSADISFFYQESELFVRFLILNYGGAKFHAFLQAAASSGKTGEALQKIYGFSVETAEVAFREYSTGRGSLPAGRRAQDGDLRSTIR